MSTERNDYLSPIDPQNFLVNLINSLYKMKSEELFDIDRQINQIRRDL